MEKQHLDRLHINSPWTHISRDATCLHCEDCSRMSAEPLPYSWFCARISDAHAWQCEPVRMLADISSIKFSKINRRIRRKACYREEGELYGTCIAETRANGSSSKHKYPDSCAPDPWCPLLSL